MIPSHPSPLTSATHSPKNCFRDLSAGSASKNQRSIPARFAFGGHDGIEHVAAHDQATPHTFDSAVVLEVVADLVEDREGLDQGGLVALSALRRQIRFQQIHGRVG